MAKEVVAGNDTERVGAKKSKKAQPTDVSQQFVPSKTTHTVSENETLSGIATKYRLSLNRLLKLNELSSPDVAVGTQLVVE